MFIIQVNDNEGVLQDLVWFGSVLSVADARFLSVCAERISNWREYTANDIQAILEDGYVKFEGGVVMLIDTSNCTTDDEIQDQLAEEVWYVWKERVTVDGEDKPRLLTPWSDPNIHEFPFDFIYDSPEDAIVARKECEAEDEDWVLCKETLTEIGKHGN